jgi:hypothetical protein
VAAEFPGCEVTVGPSGGDNRSYRVNFDRIHRELPGFTCRYTAKDGARQLREVFERIAGVKAAAVPGWRGERVIVSGDL